MKLVLSLFWWCKIIWKLFSLKYKWHCLHVLYYSNHFVKLQYWHFCCVGNILIWLLRNIIIILLCHQLWYLWPSLATSPYHSSLLAGPQGCIPILTELLYVGSSWSPCFSSAMCGGPSENITYELVPASPVVSCMSGSSNFNSFRDGR